VRFSFDFFGLFALIFSPGEVSLAMMDPFAPCVVSVTEDAFMVRAAFVFFFPSESCLFYFRGRLCTFWSGGYAADPGSISSLLVEVDPLMLGPLRSNFLFLPSLGVGVREALPSSDPCTLLALFAFPLSLGSGS